MVSKRGEWVKLESGNSVSYCFAQNLNAEQGGGSTAVSLDRVVNL